ncbi:MAG TPA: response regulator transcription factor [bacterium]|nr:response regulator transcription factor [bacterium]HPN29742.1 response regulator transcription factor [bacterium]
MRILIVEDDLTLAEFIKKGLSEEGYAVDIISNGEYGLNLALNYEFDLIILDVMLPGKDGLEICRSIRKKNKSVPVLFLSARDETCDIVKGLDSGANDYLTKPFAFPELSARIRALLRVSATPDNTGILKTGDLTLNLFLRKAERSGKKINLTLKEFSLLEYFMRNPDRILTRTMIIEHVWNFNFDNFTNVIDVYINYLRKKIDSGFEFKMLMTIRGSGYMLNSKI